MEHIISGGYQMPVPPFKYAVTPNSIPCAEFNQPYFPEPYINGGYQMPVPPFGYAGTPNSVPYADALSAEFNKPYFLEPYINGGNQMPVLPFGYVVTPNSYTWANALSAEFSKPYFNALQEFVAMERKLYTVYPPPEQVYTWTQMCSIENVKVVILGQDPYHNVGQAHGLCFSVQDGIQPPRSLKNIYEELANDIGDFEEPGHGNLTGWAEQGVLLLNAVLTVRAHTPNSHKDQGWEKFTDAVISWLNKNKEGLVFMLWGSYAQKKGAIIDTKRHCVLKSTHPSPLSAYRGFLGCGHFSKANEYLEMTGQKPIDWTKL